MGADLNPIATLITQARTDVSPADDLAAKFMLLQAEVERRQPDVPMMGIGRSALAPTTVLALDRDTELPSDELRSWYAPGTLRHLDALSRSLRLWPPKDGFRVIATACFSSVLRRLSSQEAHWGYVCDNVKPKQLVEKDVLAVYYDRVKDFLELRQRFLGLCDKRWIRRKINRPHIATGDAGGFLETIDANSVDLIVTSPPYLNVTDYVNSQRLTFLWLARCQRESLRPSEIGARYKRFRKDSLTEYIQRMTFCIRQMARVLKKDKVLAFVLGQSKSHPECVDELARVCEAAGLHMLERLSRSISLQRTLAPSVRDEEIMLYRKGAGK
jgi:hypothetical protein